MLLSTLLPKPTAIAFRDPPVGIEMTLQVVPSQCSMTEPTAQTSFEEMATTDLRTAPDTCEFGTILQLVPSQCSMSVWEPQDIWQSLASPTAQMSFAETAATAFR